MKALSTIPWDKLAEKNVDLKVVGCGKAKGIASFSKDTKFPAEKCFVDT